MVARPRWPASGVNLKRSTIISTELPVLGGFPWKSHRFIRACSPPERGTSGPE
jgi:hypothetical protein